MRKIFFSYPESFIFFTLALFSFLGLLLGCESHDMYDNPKWSCSCAIECDPDWPGETEPTTVCAHPLSLPEITGSMSDLTVAFLAEEWQCTAPVAVCSCTQIATSCDDLRPKDD